MRDTVGLIPSIERKKTVERDDGGEREGEKE